MGFGERSGAEAARRAGYKASSAAWQAHHLRRHPLVSEAVKAIADYLESTDIIDERFIINGLAREAAEAPEPRDRIVALGTLAKIRQLGSFGGPKVQAPGNVIQQVLVLAQSQGLDKETGQIRDAQRFAAQLARAFGRDQALGMLAGLGMDGQALLGMATAELGPPDIRVDGAEIDGHYTIDGEPGEASD